MLVEEATREGNCEYLVNKGRAVNRLSSDEGEGIANTRDALSLAFSANADSSGLSCCV